ncbi:MAG: hypothetical protein WAS33_06335, partial [Candidatus Promineifilaceae bacterium]
MTAVYLRRLLAIREISFLHLTRLTRSLTVPRHPFHNQVLEFPIDPLLPAPWTVPVLPAVA